MAVTQDDDLQKAMYYFNEISEAYKVEMTVEKTKLMTFRRKDPVTAKIVVSGKTLHLSRD